MEGNKVYVLGVELLQSHWKGDTNKEEERTTKEYKTWITCKKNGKIFDFVTGIKLSVNTFMGQQNSWSFSTTDFPVQQFYEKYIVRQHIFWTRKKKW